MGKTNWMRVFLGELLAGIVLNTLGFATMAMYLRGIWKPEVEALNPVFEELIGVQSPQFHIRRQDWEFCADSRIIPEL
jgi:hypothetical protein